MDTHTPSAEMATAVGLNPVPSKPERLEAVDLVRGLVMILMALDHVRDFWSDRLLMDPTDLNTTTAGIFFCLSSKIWHVVRDLLSPNSSESLILTLKSLDIRGISANDRPGLVVGCVSRRQ